MAVHTRFPSNLPKFMGKRREDVCSRSRTPAGSTTSSLKTEVRVYEESAGRLWTSLPQGGFYTGHRRREARNCAPTFRGVNYQSVLREKLQRLKQIADIETFNGEYSALIFRVEGMNILDQVLNYTNGLKPLTRSYVKPKNPDTPSEAIDLAVKYEVPHFVEETRACQVRHDEKKPSADQGPTHTKSFKGKSYRSRRRFKPNPETKRTEHRTCHLCKKPGHIKADRFSWKNQQSKQGNQQLQQALKFENTSLNALCENILVYKSRPLFSVPGEISVGDDKIITSSMLVDCRATTIYVSKRWVDEHQLQPTKLSDKSIHNQSVEVELEVLSPRITVSGLDKTRRIQGIQVILLHWERTDKISGPFEEGDRCLSRASKFGRGKGLLAKRPDPCRGVAPETDVKPEVEVVRDVVPKQPLSVVREQDIAPVGKRPTDEANAQVSKHDCTVREFTMGIIKKYITRMKLCKFLRIKTKSLDESDFMWVLSNDTIKQIDRSLQRQDQPSHVGSDKALRYLETDRDSFRQNPTLKLLMNYKDNVLRPVLPEGLPERRERENRIDVKDSNLAMYRQQLRQSPEQQREIIIDMAKKKLIRPSISSHAGSTFCIRKPAGWRIVHDYRYVNSNTILQRIPMTRK
ncbi:LOW QUALITY PROTEIN: hypothetical protein PHMEG_0002466 [Phytophthora megakarya]|uniref:Reverse transcriptase n=1 Tax=Phytophthora megakarya TaxID=4795 RepID=A0A225X0L6_9STRA|nr:LOW QUALITY PROTEIN: hypothetical protein PHMEG_0002466 [Phytophthora megakarya]